MFQESGGEEKQAEQHNEADHGMELGRNGSGVELSLVVGIVEEADVGSISVVRTADPWGSIHGGSDIQAAAAWAAIGIPCAGIHVTCIVVNSIATISQAGLGLSRARVCRLHSAESAGGSIGAGCA